MAPTPTFVTDGKFYTASTASGRALFAVVETTSPPTSITGWTKQRTGNAFTLYTRTANATSTDDFPQTYGPVIGLSFASGVTEDYTSGSWDFAYSDLTNRSAPAPNGGSALSATTDTLVVIASTFINTVALGEGDAYGPSYGGGTIYQTPSGFTSLLDNPYAYDIDEPFYYYGDLWFWSGGSGGQKVAYKTLSTSSPSTTAWSGLTVTSTADANPLQKQATLAFKDAAGGSTYTGGASLSETGTLTSSATRAANGAASLSETASLTTEATRAANADASLTGTASATVAATLTRSADVSLTGTGALTSDGSLSKTVDASLTGSASLTSTATTTQTAGASLTTTASLTATGEDTESATGALEATGDLTTDATVTKSATASLTGTGAITAATTVPVEVSSSLTGTGSLDSDGERGANTSTALSSTGALTASASLTRAVDESLAVVADLTALATIARAASATLTTVAELTSTGLNVRLPVRGTGGAVTNEALLVTSSSESIGRSRGSAE